MAASPDYDDEPRWEYDVFVSFRGEDVRGSFLSHLYKEFDREWIVYFRDDDQRDMGEEISSKLLHGIRFSKVAIVLFSSRYPDSKWCLNELEEILKFHEKHKHHGHLFMPVFFQVHPGELRRQTGAFGKSFEQVIVKSIDDLLEGKQDIKQFIRWKEALQEAGNTSGWRLDMNNGSEAELVENIVKHLVFNVLQKDYPYLPYQVVPVDSQVEKLTSLLTKSREDDVCLVGMHGKQGIGKTTLAGLVFKRIRDKFQGFSFLQLDDELDAQRLIQLQRKLVIDVLKVKHLQMDSLRTNVNEIKKRLNGKKLLLIIDNVSSKDQAKHFGVGDWKWFAPGSRVLITTRHRSLLKELQVDREYEVGKLGQTESCQLFCQLVFKSKEPKEGYGELSRRLVSCADGNPAAIENLAYDLVNQNIDQWRKKLENPQYVNSISRSNSVTANKLVRDLFGNQNTGEKVPSTLKPSREVESQNHQHGPLKIPVEKGAQSGSSSTIRVRLEGRGGTLPEASDLQVHQIQQEQVADPVLRTSANAKQTIKVPRMTQTPFLKRDIAPETVIPLHRSAMDAEKILPSKKETSARVLDEVWESIQEPFYEKTTRDATPQFQVITEASKEDHALPRGEMESRDQVATDLIQLHGVKTARVEEASADLTYHTFNLENKGNGQATKEARDPLLEEGRKGLLDLPDLPSKGIREDHPSESCIQSANDVNPVEARERAGEQVMEKKSHFKMLHQDEALEDISNFSRNNTRKNMLKGDHMKEVHSPSSEELQKSGHESSAKPTLNELLKQARTNEDPVDTAALNRNVIAKKSAESSLLQSAVNQKDIHTSKDEIPTPFHGRLANSKDHRFRESTSVHLVSKSDSVVNYQLNQKIENPDETPGSNVNVLLGITSRAEKILQEIPGNFAEFENFQTLIELLNALRFSSLPPKIRQACEEIGSRLQRYKKLFPDAKGKMQQLHSTIAEESIRVSKTISLGIIQQEAIQSLKAKRADLVDREQKNLQQIKKLQEENQKIEEELVSIAENINNTSGLIKETALQRSASEEKYRSDSDELSALQNLLGEFESSLVELKTTIHQAMSSLQS